jgi:YidC/Oxa1 family membrane protein insertase
MKKSSLATGLKKPSSARDIRWATKAAVGKKSERLGFLKPAGSPRSPAAHPCVICRGLPNDNLDVAQAKQFLSQFFAFADLAVADTTTLEAAATGTTLERAAETMVEDSSSVGSGLAEVMGEVTTSTSTMAEEAAANSGDLDPPLMEATAGAGSTLDAASDVFTAGTSASGDAILGGGGALEALDNVVSGATAAAGDTVAGTSTSALVDAATTTSTPPLEAASQAASTTLTRYDGWLSPLSNTLEKILGSIQHGLDSVHVPYSYGFSIILLTAFVRLATYPLTKKQVEVAMAAQQLKPTIDRIKRRYGDDKAKVQEETARLYEMTKINPLAGCLPSLASVPIFLGLYYSLGNVANEGALDDQGFFWIPSLAGPTSLAARSSGSGTAWLLPFVDGHPPIGWANATPYLILPVLLVVIQYVLTALITPPKDPLADPKDENQSLQIITKFLPLFLGWFALNVPAGLTLYYFSNISLVSAQQIYLRKLGGATVDLGIDLPEEKYGVGRRSIRTEEDDQSLDAPAAEVVLVDDVAETQQTTNNGSELGSQNGATATAAIGALEQEGEEVALASNGMMFQEQAGELKEEEEKMNRMCKRKRLIPAPGSAIAIMQQKNA